MISFAGEFGKTEKPLTASSKAMALRRAGTLHRQILDAVEQAVIATDLEGDVIYLNRFAEALFGWPAAQALGRPVAEIAPSQMTPPQAMELIRHMAMGERFMAQQVLRRRDGTTFDAAVTVTPVVNSRGRQIGMVGLSRDISAGKEAERRRETQFAVTRALAESTTLAEVVLGVLGALGTGLQWDLGILWMVDWGAEVMRCVDVWRANRDRFRLFEELSRGMVFPEGVELSGRVWQEADVVFSRDLAALLSPPRALVAANEGLQAAIGFPVKSSRGVIGAVTFYAREMHEPDADLRSMLLASGSQIGMFTDRREAERLESSLAQLRALSRRLVAVREEERAIASREFHDQLGQSLTGLKLDLAWVRRQVAGLEKRPPQVDDKIREMSSQIDAVIQTVRQVITELRPRVLDELGLVAAVEWLTRDFQRRSGTTCELRVEVPEGELDDARRTAVFRILQEILTNVARHAEASLVTVSLRVENGQFVLQVMDNGRGITEGELTARSSLGLLGMRERAHACNGTIEFTGSPRVGTTVTMRIPLDHRANQ